MCVGGVRQEEPGWGGRQRQVKKREELVVNSPQGQEEGEEQRACEGRGPGPRPEELAKRKSRERSGQEREEARKTGGNL